MTIEAMGTLVPQLAETRRVIGVELQGHGHTGDIERTLRYEWMADDIAALIRHLGLDQADVFGFSLGGGVGLQTAIRHHKVVRKLVLASTAFRRDGWYPEALAGMAAISVDTFAGTPIHEAYLKTSPNPEAWPAVVAKMRHLLVEEYDWAASVAALTIPTLILVGDADGVRLAHAVKCFGLLGGGQADGDLVGIPLAQLAVLPATTHVGWAPPYHYWNPKVIGEINDYDVKIVKVHGQFVWHTHDQTDELFLVIEGRLGLQVRELSGEERTIWLERGEMIIIPHGIEHCPIAEIETHILLLEPKGTVNTGDTPSDLTVHDVPHM